jgi:hypothetical protein
VEKFCRANSPPLLTACLKLALERQLKVALLCGDRRIDFVETAITMSCRVEAPALKLVGNFISSFGALSIVLYRNSPQFGEYYGAFYVERRVLKLGQLRYRYFPPRS